MSFFFFKQKTAYEMRISDWSSDVCSSDLGPAWWVLEEVEVAVADAPLATYATAAAVVAALVVLAVAIALGAFWWRLASLHDRALAEQYRVLANRIQATKQDRQRVV